MRIIAGKWRSRKLVFRAASQIRPMPDRVRESVFDILAARFHLPGELPPFEVADMFAGSGSMGLEALSRGAGQCDFVERVREALDTLRHNVRDLKGEAVCRIHRADAWTICLTRPRRAEGYGLIVVDPPYADSRDTSRGGKTTTLLSDLFRAGWADEHTIVVLHHPARAMYQGNDDAVWQACDRRVYGTTGITFVKQRAREHQDSVPESCCRSTDFDT